MIFALRSPTGCASGDGLRRLRFRAGGNSRTAPRGAVCRCRSFGHLRHGGVAAAPVFALPNDRTDIRKDADVSEPPLDDEGRTPAGCVGETCFGRRPLPAAAALFGVGDGAFGSNASTRPSTYTSAAPGGLLYPQAEPSPQHSGLFPAAWQVQLDPKMGRSLVAFTVRARRLTRPNANEAAKEHR
jgi:hypothetical protein